MPGDDAELVRRWQEGDPAAFEALVRRWQQPVARFLSRYTGRPDRAADLTQEVFLRVYLAGARYRPTAAFSTWLYTIAVNAARDAARRGRIQPLPLDGHDLPDPQPAGDVVCLRREAVRAVARAVAELPEPLRLVLVLHHYEHVGFEELSRLTDTPASTLKSRYAVALRRLRARLHQLGFGPEENDS